MRKYKAELLAPAGSFETMKAVISAGADAVYMGGPMFGARAYADNPEIDTFLEAIDYAHLREKKLYMTVNTLLKEKEISNMLYDYLLPLYKRGLDAVIVQDLGVFDFIREAFPDLPIHISTQMTVTGAMSAKYFKERGATRVVTARELNLKELREISKVGLEVESFVHGAICYCYSGKCLFSSLAGGRSGNRGRCAQPCRQQYDLTDDKNSKCNVKKEKYLLSLKDMNTLEILPDIIKSGVYSLKIEGRMKKTEYAAGVVSIYRKYIDMFLDGKEYKVDAKDQERLWDLFNRNGFSTGYYNQKNGRDMMSLSESSFRSHDDAFLKEIKTKYIDNEAKAKVDIFAEVHSNEAISLACNHKDVYAYVCGDIPEISKNKPVSKEQLAKQLSKTGGTDFFVDKLEISMDDNLFIPVKALNEVRRNALEELRDNILSEYLRDKEKLPAKAFFEERRDKQLVSAWVSSLGQLKACLLYDMIDRIYISPDLCKISELGEICQMVKKAGKECYYSYFEPFRQEQNKFYNNNLDSLKAADFDGFLCESIESLSYTKKYFGDKKIVAGHSLYTWNSFALRSFLKICDMVTGPLELNLAELKARGMINTELIVYGYYPIMVTAGCVYKSTKGCIKRNDNYPIWGTLTDSSGRKFPVKSECAFCGNTIYNLAPTVLYDMESVIKDLKPAGLRLAFTKESENETIKVLDGFIKGVYLGDFTRGQIKRGVE